MTETPAAVPATSRSAWRVTAQLLGLWVAAIVTYYTAGWLVPVAAFLNAPGLLVPVVGLVYGLSFLAGTMTPAATRFTATAGRRALWAGVVAVGGFLVVIFTAAVSTDARPPVVVGMLMLTLPFPAVGAALMDRWPARLVGLAYLAVLVAIGIATPGSFGEFWELLRSFNQ
ncbi:hypothetical protein ABZ863_14090 [Saccharomonospora sp. NPDC046836]|uniref:hypothetical protein n=1 Tax=Saccharomonospora sp. NPDC046836 TaxID=3156921 RepID=UPI00340762E9